jgi:hypothetical protein
MARMRCCTRFCARVNRGKGIVVSWRCSCHNKTTNAQASIINFLQRLFLPNGLWVVMLSPINSCQLRLLAPAATTAVFRGMESPFTDSTRTVAMRGDGFPLFHNFEIRNPKSATNPNQAEEANPKRKPCRRRSLLLLTSSSLFRILPFGLRRGHGLVGIEPQGDHC